MESQDIVLGIDLGTTFSAAAFVDTNGIANIIPNSQGARTTPSVVMIRDKENDIIVGQEAKDSLELYPDRVIAFAKREMGKKPDEVRDGKTYHFWNRDLSPEEISSFVLKQLKEDAENHLKATIKDAVISVPAYFSDLERGATIRAGELAGLNVLRIINEPTAAALYYGFNKSNEDQKAFVFDLGGGTFDVTILQIQENKIKVIGTDGDHKLGGVDWDNRIIDYVADQFLLEYGLDPREDVDAMAELRERIERAKIQLSEIEQTKVIVNAHGKKLSINFSRELFENLTSDLLERSNDLCRLVLKDCNLSWNNIDTIILAGGSTRMPMVKNMLCRESGKTIESNLVNPDECVAFGAAFQAEMLKQKSEPSYLPQAKQTQSFGISEISDATAHSLGMIVLNNGEFRNSIIIPKNHSFPCELSKSDFSTSYDNQETLDVHVVQGEAENPFHCTVLDSYEFYDIPKRPRGKTQIKVTFKYNSNCQVEVNAVDMNSNASLPFLRKDKPNLDDLENGVSKPIDVGLLIDCSGSMSGKPLEDAKQAANSFIKKINLESNQVGVISFHSRASIIHEMTKNENSLFESISSIYSTGSTNMAAAIRIARKELLSVGNRDKVIVLLTDGSPDNDRLTMEESRNAKNSGIRIIAIGVGTGVDSEFLKKLASSSEDYHFVNESFELESTFINIATELSTGRIQTI